LYTVKGHPVVAMATTTETGEGYDCVIDFLKFPVFF